MRDVKKVPLTLDERAGIYAACVLCAHLEGVNEKDSQMFIGVAEKLWKIDTNDAWSKLRQMLGIL